MILVNVCFFIDPTCNKCPLLDVKRISSEVSFLGLFGEVKACNSEWQQDMRAISTNTT